MNSPQGYSSPHDQLKKRSFPNLSSDPRKGTPPLLMLLFGWLRQEQVRFVNVKAGRPYHPSLPDPPLATPPPPHTGWPSTGGSRRQHLFDSIRPFRLCRARPKKRSAIFVCLFVCLWPRKGVSGIVNNSERHKVHEVIRTSFRISAVLCCLKDNCLTASSTDSPRICKKVHKFTLRQCKSRGPPFITWSRHMTSTAHLMIKSCQGKGGGSSLSEGLGLVGSQGTSLRVGGGGSARR